MDCTAIGLAMALTAYLCAYYNFRDSDNYHRDQDYALRQLAEWKKAIDVYHQKNGKYPRDADELKQGPPPLSWMDDRAFPPDPWDHPYQYLPKGNGYAILSWGRDGKSGGEGFDHDLAVTDRSQIGDGVSWRQSVDVPTLRQFTTDYPTHGMRLPCGL
ncbi:MAG: hypothetical protein ABS79_08060, partial [Planctomycetes bacterium SCN 63-9]